MRQAVMTEPGTINIREVPAPSAGPGEVLLRIRRIGVCGSDVHVYHGRHPYTTYPVVQGHEFAATVESMGPGVAGIRQGMKVTATPQVVCGQCPPCRRGAYNICNVLKVQGFQAPGCAQDFFVTSADKLVPLPEHFTFEQGAMVEPAAVAVHAVARAEPLAGRNVVVLGAGPIGNLVAQVARAAGARVLITDLSKYRLAVARRCGLEATAQAREESLAAASTRVFGDSGFDIAFECVGAETTMTEVIACVAKGGTIVVVGVFGQKPRVDMGLVQDRELRLMGTLMYRLEDYRAAVRLIDQGGITAGPLESRHFPFAEYGEAYRFIDREGENSLKVFIDL
jgi:L-iditol 2-dehydrogenase